MAAGPTQGQRSHEDAARQVADSGVTRQRFLSLSSVGLGAAIGAVIGVPAAAYVLAPVTEEVTFEPVFLGATDSFSAPPPGQFKAIAAQYIETSRARHELGSGVGREHGQDQRRLAGARQHVHRLFEPLHPRRLPVVATGVGFSCPCHGSQFDQHGARIAGPAIRPLDRFQWQIRNSNELWITQRWSVDFVNGKLTYYPVKMPGQPVHAPGPWGDTVPGILYPNVTYTHGAVPKAK